MYLPGTVISIAYKVFLNFRGCLEGNQQDTTPITWISLKQVGWGWVDHKYGQVWHFLQSYNSFIDAVDLLKYRSVMFSNPNPLIWVIVTNVNI